MLQTAKRIQSPFIISTFQLFTAFKEPLMPSLIDRFQLLLLTGFTYSCCLHAIANDSIPAWTQGDVATSVDELWRDYNPRKESLDVKIVRSWQQDNVQIHYVVYTIGVFKGQKSTMAAFYTTPIEPTQKLPAVLFIHGGGQRAYLRGSIEYARRGYCCLSPNWGGREMENARPGDLNTDWGAVDPTQSNPQGYSSVLPGPKKIDPFESPRNNHWYLLTIGCRRAITFWSSRKRSTRIESVSWGIRWEDASLAWWPVVTNESR